MLLLLLLLLLFLFLSLLLWGNESESLDQVWQSPVTVFKKNDRVRELLTLHSGKKKNGPSIYLLSGSCVPPPMHCSLQLWTFWYKWRVSQAMRTIYTIHGTPMSTVKKMVLLCLNGRTQGIALFSWTGVSGAGLSRPSNRVYLDSVSYMLMQS